MILLNRSERWSNEERKKKENKQQLHKTSGGREEEEKIGEQRRGSNLPKEHVKRESM